MEKVNRPRGRNFTENEKEILISICMEFKDILENKKTNNTWVFKKRKAWEQITRTFNATQTSGIRDIKSIKDLYDNLKKRSWMKRRKRDDRIHLITTGEIPYLKREPLGEKQISESPDPEIILPDDGCANCYRNKLVSERTRDELETD